LSRVLVRVDLDRKLLDEQERIAGNQAILVSCERHPGALLGVLYTNEGQLRLLCPACGFEVMAIKVADEPKSREDLEGRRQSNERSD
jgi:hypothetical protein